MEKPLTEKQYCEKKLVGFQYGLYDIYFKMFKVKVRREETRQNYDGSKSKLEALNTQIKTQKEKPTMPQGDIARLDDDKVRLEKDIQDLEHNLKVWDEVLGGAKPSAENPEGLSGLQQEIDNARDTIEIMKLYIKQLK